MWVENTQTGDMIPVVRRNAKASRTGARRRGTSSGGGGEGGADADEGGEEGDELLDLERGAGGAGPDAFSSLLSVPPMPPPLDEEGLASVGIKGKGSQGASVSHSLQKQEAEIAPIVSYHNLVMVQRAIFLVFQGLQAGFCFTTLFTVQAAVSTDGLHSRVVCVGNPLLRFLLVVVIFAGRQQHAAAGVLSAQRGGLPPLLLHPVDHLAGGQRGPLSDSAEQQGRGAAQQRQCAAAVQQHLPPRPAGSALELRRFQRDSVPADRAAVRGGLHDVAADE